MTNLSPTLSRDNQIFPESLAIHFKKLYQFDKLAPLYLYSGRDFSLVKEELFVFFNGIIDDQLALNNHPDFIHLSEEKLEHSQYTLENFQEVFQFIPLRPSIWKHKFVLIESAHLISELIFNKLLKPMESHQYDISVILICENDSHILPTIKSRAILLRTPLSYWGHKNQNLENKTLSFKYPFLTHQSKENEKHDFFMKKINDYLGKKLNDKIEEINQTERDQLKVIQDFLKAPRSRYFSPELIDLEEMLKKDQKLWHEFLNWSIEWECLSLSPYSQKKKFLQTLKWYEEVKTFHNSPSEATYALLKELI
jgi:DNA polymerase III delta prime subunit